MALWSVLLAPRYPIITDLIEFLTVSTSLSFKVPQLTLLNRKMAPIRVSIKIFGTWWVPATTQYEELGFIESPGA